MGQFLYKNTFSEDVCIEVVLTTRLLSESLIRTRTKKTLTYADQVDSRDVELETLAYYTAEMAVVIDQPLRLP